MHPPPRPRRWLRKWHRRSTPPLRSSRVTTHFQPPTSRRGFRADRPSARDGFHTPSRPAIGALRAGGSSSLLRAALTVAVWRGDSGNPSLAHVHAHPFEHPPAPRGTVGSGPPDHLALRPARVQSAPLRTDPVRREHRRPVRLALHRFRTSPAPRATGVSGADRQWRRLHRAGPDRPLGKRQATDGRVLDPDVAERRFRGTGRATGGCGPPRVEDVDRWAAHREFHRMALLAVGQAPGGLGGFDLGDCPPCRPGHEGVGKSATAPARARDDRRQR